MAHVRKEVRSKIKVNVGKSGMGKEMPMMKMDKAMKGMQGMMKADMNKMMKKGMGKM